jgi:hypothetical protein
MRRFSGSDTEPGRNGRSACTRTQPAVGRRDQLQGAGRLLESNLENKAKILMGSWEKAAEQSLRAGQVIKIRR